MAKKVIVGDIWKQKGFKVVSTNLGGVHGRGLAAQAKQQGKITASNKSFATSPKNSDVITLAVKGNAPETAKVRGQAYSEQTTGKNVELLKSEVKQLIQFARKNPTKNINLPFVGLGFGEGKPDEILPILREAEKEPNIHLISKDEATVKRYQSTFRAGVRSDKSKVKNLSKAIQSRIGPPPKQTNAPSNAKTIYFQGPASGISDPKAFKRGLTKKYSEARKRWSGKGPIQVQYRGSKTSQADQLIGEWASEGLTKYLPPSRDPKKLQTVSRGHLFRTNEKGLPIRKKEPINISKIDAPGESVETISFSREGKMVYPGKDTKPHHARFLELTGSPKQGGLGLKKGVEAYLDELEDIGRGTTKQALDKPYTLSIKGKKVTRLPIIGKGQGEVTKVEANPKSMLAGLQVIEDKAKYFDFDEVTLDRISNMKKDVSHPLGSGERIATAEADSPEDQYIDTDDDAFEATPKQPKVKKSALTDAKFRAALKANVSKTNELKPELKDWTDDDDEVIHLSKVKEEDISQEDAGLRKENFKLDTLRNIKRVSGSEAWKKFTKSPFSKRIFLNVLGDIHKVDTTLGPITSKDPVKKKQQLRKVISGPHKKGILIKADPTDTSEKGRNRLWREKQYIEHKVTRKPDDYPRNVSRKDIALQVRKEITEDKQLAKRKRVGAKVSMLRRSGDRALADIKKFTTGGAGATHIGKTHGAIRYGLMPWMVKGIKIPEKSFPKKPPHTPGLKADAPIEPLRKKVKTVTSSITKIKPLSKKAEIKGMEDKIKVTAKKKTIKVDEKGTKKITKALQKTFHGKDKPGYKSTAGKGLKFTRGLGAFTIFSSVLGLVKGRAEAKKELGREPTIMETFNFTVLPKEVRMKMPKYQARRFTPTPDIQ